MAERKILKDSGIFADDGGPDGIVIGVGQEYFVVVIFAVFVKADGYITVLVFGRFNVFYAVRRSGINNLILDNLIIPD